jgi:hypothetical protein
MKNIESKIQVLTKTSAIAFLLSGCAFSMNFEQGQSSTGGGVNPPGVVGATAGTEHFESVYINMYLAAGIPRTTCNSAYLTQRANLPIGNDLATLTAAAQAAALKLAACVCEGAIINNQNNARATLTPGFNYSKAGNALTDSDIEALSTGVMNAAWGVNVSLSPDRTQTKATLNKLVKNLVAADSAATSSASTGRAAFGVCTAILGSVASQTL